MPDPEPHVVIVGAGFGGLAAAKAFRNKPVRVTIVDRTNHHLFQPLLYQVATAGLNPADIASPVRHILRSQTNVTCLMGSVTAIDVDKRELSLDDGDTRLSYDYLIVAAGGRTSYFGHDEWEEMAPGLKTLEDARRIRERVLCSFEHAEKESDEATRQKLMTIVVVGGGPTGVELAGAFAELSRRVLVSDFRNIHPELARIILLDAADRILLSYAPELSENARIKLQAMGVTVRTGVKVKELREGAVVTDQETIEAANIVWAAGIGAVPLAGRLGAPTDRAGRIKVDADLRVPGQERVYCIGDMAAYEHPHTYGGKLLPGVSPVAINQGEHAVKNILRQIQNQTTLPFDYHDPGSMATIGRSAAIAQVGNIKLTGFIAWLAWLFIHLIKLVGFHNRVMVLMQWAWAYLFWRRGARLVTEPQHEKEVAEAAAATVGK